MNLTKIVSTDELRPALRCAVLMNGYFYATEGHILIKIKAEDAFTVETDYKVFDIENLKVIARSKELVFKEDFFYASGRKYRYAGTIDPETREMRMDEFSCNRAANELEYPDIEHVLKFGDPTELKEIGLNPVLLERLSKGFVGCMTGSFRLKFTGQTKSVIVIPGEETGIEQFGIIMPTIISEQ